MEERQERALREYNNLYHLESNIYHKAALAIGLSDSAFEVLYSLCDLGDGCLQKDICEASYLSKQTVNTSVHKLERAGILRLEIERGRGTHLYLTQAGRALVNERIVPLTQIEKEAFGALTPQESDELLQLMRRYLERLDDLVDNLHVKGFDNDSN